MHNHRFKLYQDCMYLYNVLVCIVLVIFSFNQVKNYNLKNVTTHEDVENVWNGNAKNKESRTIFEDKSTALQKLLFFLFCNQGESKLDKFAHLKQI